MDFKNFKNETFDVLPELIIGSNFEDCTFKVAAKFERCNIRKSTFEKPSEFYLSNIINCEVAEGSTFEKSSNVKEDEEERLHRMSRPEHK